MESDTSVSDFEGFTPEYVEELERETSEFSLNEPDSDVSDVSLSGEEHLVKVTIFKTQFRISRQYGREIRHQFVR